MITKKSVVLRITRCVLIVLAGLCLLSWNPVPGFAQGVAAGQIEGLWALTLTLPPNPFLPTQFIFLSNFTRDGNFISSSNLPTLPVDPRFPFPKLRAGTGHGVWTLTGQPPGFSSFARGKIHLELWRFITCAQAQCVIPSPPFPVSVTGNDGDFMGWARGQAEVTLNPRTGTMEGIVQVQLYAPNRQTPLLPPLPGTVVGERIQPEPF